MKARREHRMEISGAYILRRETKAYAEVGEPMLPRKTSRKGRRRPYQNRHRWAGRAYRGDRNTYEIDEFKANLDDILGMGQAVLKTLARSWKL